MLSVFLVSFAAAAFSYEWSGIFPKEGTWDAEASLTWYVQKVGTAQTYGTAGDMMMKLAIFDGGAEATRTALDAKKLDGEALIAGTTCADVESGTTLTVDTTTGSCYNLKFKDDASVRESSWTITKPAGVKTLVFFGEHDPHEFEDKDDGAYVADGGKHYFKDAAGTDIEPAAMGPTLWEWSGVFATPKDEYTWVAQKVGGSYADEYMYLIALDAAAADEATLDALAADKALAGYAAACVANAATNGAGTAITPTAEAGTVTCNKLVFDDTARESTWKINTAASMNVAFFAQHVPTEFEDSTADDGKHYFLDESTDPVTDVEPGFQENRDGAAPHSHGSDDGHGKTCGCESIGDIPFTIDCSKNDAAQQVIRDAMTNLTACPKTTACKTTETCQKAFFIIQSHHDHCDHETLLKAEETTMHDYEAFCTNCQIYREYKDGNQDCFFMPADADKYCNDIKTDTKPVDDALALLQAGCTIDGACCTSPALIGAFANIVAYHDLCDPNDLPETVEKAFHDYEEGCEDHFCNMIDATYDGKACDGVAAPNSHAALFGLLAAAVLAA